MDTTQTMPRHHRETIEEPGILTEREIRRLTALSLQAQKEARESSSCNSIDTAAEGDIPAYETGGRRGTAPELRRDTTKPFFLTHSRRLDDLESPPSSRRGSCPLIVPSPADRSRQALVRKLHGALTPKRHSLLGGKEGWSDSTITMGGSQSVVGSLNGLVRPPKFKIILLGDCGVGKSSFLQTLVSGQRTLSTDSSSRVCSTAVLTVPYQDLEVELQFVDTAGQERYRSITASYYRHAQGSFVFFNVNYRPSFEHVESWLEDLKKYSNNNNMAVILIGLTHQHKPTHKKQASWDDLLQPFKTTEERLVSRAEAEHLAMNNKIPYLEANIESDQDSVPATLTEMLDLLMGRFIPTIRKPSIIKPSHRTNETKCCRTC